jgi:DNA polymerase-3 subunit alpha
MAKYKGRFIDGCAGNKIEKKLANDIFDMIEKFAGYGFPKAHSAAYGVITAQTAYLKARYPVQFMAALMSTEMGSTEKTVFNVTECRRAGIPLLPPNVNRSQLEFSVEDVDGVSGIRFGLGVVKNVGYGAVESILASRAEQPRGEFGSLEAFCDAVDWSTANKRVAECLAKSGSLDPFGERAAILASLDTLIGAAQQRQKASARGQMDLFGGMNVEPAAVAAGVLDAVTPADRKQLLAWEKELIGLYLSSHPLMDWTGSGAPEGYATIADIAERGPGAKARFLGMVTSVRRITTRNNRTMAVMEVEDLTGSMEVVAFPDSYEQHSDLIVDDAILSFTAKVDERGEKAQLILESATSELPTPVEPVEALPVVVVVVQATQDLWGDISRMQEIDEILRRHEGDNEVEINLALGTDVLRLRSKGRKVEWSAELAQDLAAIPDAAVTCLVDDGRLAGGTRLGELPELQEVA